MNTENEQSGTIGEPQQPATTAATETPPTPVSIDSAFFSPDNLEPAQDAINKALAIAHDAGIPVVQNFGDDDELPDNFGVAIRPVSQRGKGLLGVIVAFVPSVTAIAGHEKGGDFISDVVTSNLLDKMVMQVRGRGADATFGGTLPKTLEQFLAPSSRGETLAAFREVQSLFVAALKKKGAKKMTAVLLRQVCESAAFAEAEFPATPQEAWVNIINTMKAKAATKGHDGSLFDHWIETRDKVEVETTELDLSDLDGLVE